MQIEADRLQHEGRETGLVLVVEPDALDAPAPPLHVLDVAHACAPSLGFDAPRIRSAWASRRRTISARMRDVKSPTLSPSACDERRAEDDPHREASGLRPFRPARVRDAGADQGHRNARHAGRRGERGGAGLEGAELAVARTGALGEDEQRHPLLEQHLGADAARVRAGPVDGERVEEQRGETPAPPDVEEVVGGGAGREIARHPAGKRTEDERGVEVARVVRDDDESAAHPAQVLAPDHGHAHDRPGDRFEDRPLGDEPRRRLCSGGESVQSSSRRRASRASAPLVVIPPE